MIQYWEGFGWEELVAETEDAVMVSWRWVGVQNNLLWFRLRCA
jgi:hypothetical protein